MGPEQKAGAADRQNGGDEGGDVAEPRDHDSS
jgi:hypothetical protein